MESVGYILYAVFALGGVGLYLMLPKGDRSTVAAGAIFGLSALAVLIVALVSREAPGGDASPLFYLFAAIALAAATRVVTHTNPVYSAVYFILVVVSVAALMVLQSAEFLAVSLIVVYAGAILVTYVFVIMLAQQPTAPTYDRYAREPLAAVAAGFVLMAAIAAHAGHPPELVAAVSSDTVALAAQVMDPAPDDANGHPSVSLSSNSREIGELVMTRYVVALEIAGMLLLVAMVGAVAMSRKRIPIAGAAAKPRPLGEIGKKVSPF